MGIESIKGNVNKYAGLKWITYISLIMLTVFISFYKYGLYPKTSSDEGISINAGITLANTGNWGFEDQAGVKKELYPAGSTTGPVAVYPVGLAMKFLGRSMVVFRIFPVLYTIFFLVSFYLLSTILFIEHNSRLLSYLFVCVNPILINQGRVVHGDILALSFILLGVYFLFKISGNRWMKPVIGALWGLAFLTKPETMLVLVTLAVFEIITCRKILKSIGTVIGILCGFLFVVGIWYGINFTQVWPSEGIRSVYFQILAVTPTISPASLIQKVVSIGNLYKPFLLISFIAYGFRLSYFLRAKERNDKIGLFLIIFQTTWLILPFVLKNDTRLFAPFMLLSCFWLGEFCVRAAERINWLNLLGRTWKSAATFILAVGVIGIFNWAIIESQQDDSAPSMAAFIDENIPLTSSVVVIRAFDVQVLAEHPMLAGQKSSVQLLDKANYALIDQESFNEGLVNISDISDFYLLHKEERNFWGGGSKGYLLYARKQ